MSFLLLCLLAGIMGAKAQIGYQISLLNTATGEARANERVTVEVKLSNNAGEVFYSETKQATTNDFGVLSLSIGNADTFADVDFSKMPFFIEVAANGIAIGKSQMLSVPVAEYAKKIGDLTKEKLVGTWGYLNHYKSVMIIFNANGTGTYREFYEVANNQVHHDYNFQWSMVDGVHLYYHYVEPNDNEEYCEILHYQNGMLLGDSGYKYTKQ